MRKEKAYKEIDDDDEEEEGEDLEQVPVQGRGEKGNSPVNGSTGKRWTKN